jgi:hypothetical protein
MFNSILTIVIPLLIFVLCLQYDDIPAQYVPTQRHLDLCKQEFLAAQTDPASARRTKIVRKKMSKEKPTDFGGDIAWETELKAFASLPYPPYYKLPFHSIAGGWLSKQAVSSNTILGPVKEPCVCYLHSLVHTY